MQDKKRLPWAYQATIQINYSGHPGAPGLKEIGTNFKTDKITHHHYDIYYTRFIEGFRNFQGGAILEIGIDQGASLQTWLGYFPAAFIYGIDINLEAEGERYRIFRADQSDLPSMTNIVDNELLGSR